MSDVVLAVAENRRGKVRDVSESVVGVGREIAREIDGELHVVVLTTGGEFNEDKLNRAGVERIYTIDVDSLDTHSIYLQALGELCRSVTPVVISLPHTAEGYEYAPALANELDYPLLTDVVELERSNGTVGLVRNQFGSKVRATFEAPARFACTVREATFDTPEQPGEAEVVPFEPDFDESEYRCTVLGYEDTTSEGIDITSGDVIVGIGRGIDDEENLDLVRHLCETIGGTLACSRPLVDKGWLPKSRQVGQSGKAISPDIYIAIGISGAVEHLAGMKDSDTIIAINSDPKAPILNVADYAIVDDLFDVVPALIETVN